MLPSNKNCGALGVLFTVIAGLFVSTAAPGQRGTNITVRAGAEAVETDTLETALNSARILRSKHPDIPIIIQLPAGQTRITAPLRLTKADSGSVNAPLQIRGAANGKSIITGAEILDISPSGGPKSYDLVKKGSATPFRFEMFGSGSSFPPTFPLIFQGDQRLDIARWPANGYASDWRPNAMTNSVVALRPPGGTPALRASPWIEGFFSEDWLFEAVAAQRTSGGLSVSTASGAPTRVRETAWLRLANDPAFLRRGTYVFYPQTTRVDVFARTGAEPLETAIADTLLELDGVSHVRISDLRLVKARITPVVVRGANDIIFSDCVIGHAGRYAIDVQSSRNVTIRHCLLDDTGSSAAFLEGGDRSTLLAGKIALIDSTVTNAAATLRTAPAIALWGVGNAVTGSRFDTMPGSAIALHGNDHSISDNEIGGSVCEMSDAGAIYMGRDWTQRGIRIERNFIHDIGNLRRKSLVSGIYLDDQFSGAVVADNILLRMAHGVFIGGGRDNKVERNVFVNMLNSAVYLDARGMTWQKSLGDPNGTLRTNLMKMPVQGDLWRRRYPDLAGMLANHPGEPIGNSANDNVYIEAQDLWRDPLNLPSITHTASAPNLTDAERAAINLSSNDAYTILRRFTRLTIHTPGQNAGPIWMPIQSQPKTCDDTSR